MIEDHQIKLVLSCIIMYYLSKIFQYYQLPQPPIHRLRGPATRSLAHSGPETSGHGGMTKRGSKKTH
jgi:hypothetical protein